MAAVKKRKVALATDSDGLEDVVKEQGMLSSIERIYDVHLKEKDVGITEYVGKHKGFFAILKLRYADFTVHEIGLNQEVVQLTSYESPASDDDQGGHPVECTSLSVEDHMKLQELNEGSDKMGFHLIPSIEDKEARTAVHETIKRLYPKLTSTTTCYDDQRTIKVELSKFAGNKQRQHTWPKHRGDYCRFVLYKENRDTMEAVSVLARLLNSTPRSFHYAGTKDKRGITSQAVTVYRVKGSRLCALNKTLRNMRVGNFEYVSAPLKLGDLTGNRFTVVLRELGATQEEVDATMRSMQENGFINYFGMQRFGTSVIPTHEIGRVILLCDWHKALDLVLKPRDGEADDITKARQVWAKTRDPEKALDVFPKRRNAERCALYGIKTHGDSNPLAAILKIPRNTRLIYVHSYQSYVWNRIVSRRVSEHGLILLIGDLVKKHSVQGPVKDSSEVEYVTADNIGSHCIYDLLHPLPGFDILYPANEVSSWYDSVLADDGIDKSQLNCRVKEFALPGGYRFVFAKPSDVSWSLVNYRDYTLSLVTSDLDRLEGAEKDQSKGKEDGNPTFVSKEEKEDDREDPPHSALVVHFSLPASTYATIAVREITKMDSSISHQASLNPSTGVNVCHADPTSS